MQCNTCNKYRKHENHEMALYLLPRPEHNWSVSADSLPVAEARLVFCWILNIYVYCIYISLICLQQLKKCPVFSSDQHTFFHPRILRHQHTLDFSFSLSFLDDTEAGASGSEVSWFRFSIRILKKNKTKQTTGGHKNSHVTVIWTYYSRSKNFIYLGATNPRATSKE